MVYKISIIGAGGRMGSWFARHVSGIPNTELSLYDIEPFFYSITNARLYDDIEKCVSDSDMVIVCTPLDKTPSIVLECSKNMKDDACLIEISSIKSKSFPTLQSIPSSIHPVCIHPMFGPGADNISNVKILLVPVRNQQKELELTNTLFKNTNIIIISSYQEHDNLMAIILGITYFSNIIFGHIVSQNNLIDLKRISGTTFGIQSTLCEGIFSDSLELIVSLLVENPSLKFFVENYIAESHKIAKMMFDNEFSALETELHKIKNSLLFSSNLRNSYNKMYAMYDILNAKNNNDDKCDK